MKTLEIWISISLYLWFKEWLLIILRADNGIVIIFLGEFLSFKDNYIFVDEIIGHLEFASK